METPRPRLSQHEHAGAAQQQVDQRLGAQLEERLGHAPSFEAKMQFIEAEQALQALNTAAEKGELAPADEAALQVLNDRMAQIGDEEHIASLASDSQGLAQQLGVLAAQAVGDPLEAGALSQQPPQPRLGGF